MHQLQDICYAEKQLVKALPKMAEKAAETCSAWSRCSGCTGPRLWGGDCPAIDGIIEEAKVADKNVLDVALINAAQAAEHYEIVRYGSLVAWAKQLGRNDCASVLQKTLDEEKATDKKLTTLAEGKINLRAAS